MPILPVPDSVGAATSAGATAASPMTALTVRRKVFVATPPELVAVTSTSMPSRSASVRMTSCPVSGSIDTPSPVTPNLSAAPVKPEIAFNA